MFHRTNPGAIALAAEELEKAMHSLKFAIEGIDRAAIALGSGTVAGMTLHTHRKTLETLTFGRAGECVGIREFAIATKELIPET